MTELMEPKPPIRIDVVQKQFKNGMKLPQLAQLYDVSEETLVSEIRELAEKEQMSKYAIAEVLAKPTSKIERIARDYNITIPVRSRSEPELKPKPVASSDEPKRRGPKLKLTEDEMDALAERVRELAVEKQLSISAIGRELGYPLARIRQVVKKYDIPLTKSKNDPTRLSKEDWQERLEAIKVMASEGKGATQIAEFYDISRSYVTKMCRKHGINLNAKIGRPKKNKSEPAPKKPKEEPTMPDTMTASVESAVTAFKEEEKPDLIGMLHDKMEHIARTERIEKRVLNRDKAVWGEYLTARSEDIADVTHNVDVVVEDGKLIERTTLTYTLERELTK